MIYNRALHIDDYNELAPWVNRLNEFEHYLNNQLVPYRKDHKHREWEYSSILQQLEQLGIPKPARIHDTGSGGSYFPPFLAREGWKIDVSDSMHYGDIIHSFLVPQCTHLGIEIPVYSEPVEQLSSIADESVDVAMCISVIEHVDPSQFVKALQELYRITKQNGYIFITSDFFRDEAQADASPFRQIQHNIFTPEKAAEIETLIPVSFVGGKDFSYRGDFVNNYSFLNLCLQKD